MICLLQERKSLWEIWEGWWQIASSTLSLMSSQPHFGVARACHPSVLAERGLKARQPTVEGVWLPLVAEIGSATLACFCPAFMGLGTTEDMDPSGAWCVRAICFSTFFCVFHKPFLCPQQHAKMHLMSF